MKKILIFGNSGSGKTSLAEKLAAVHRLGHLDLDSLAWQPSTPPERAPLSTSGGEILDFISENPGWVIEGCYADLLEIAVPYCNEMIYLDTSVHTCKEHARARPWEPHKYASKALQDANLPMLLEWIEQYNMRTDSCGEKAHIKLFASFEGRKRLGSQGGGALG